MAYKKLQLDAARRLAKMLAESGDVKERASGQGFATICAGARGATSVRLRGITKLLHDKFWPDYRYTGRNDGGKAEKRFAPRGLRGAARGTRVDTQVREVVRVIMSGKRVQWSNLHPLTRKLLNSLFVLKLTPAVAQVAVGDPEARLGTGVDLVCVDNATGYEPTECTVGLGAESKHPKPPSASRRKPVLVEIKCGFDGYLDATNGHMKSVLKDFPNSPRWQHQAQLAVTWELFRRTFGMTPHAAYVLNPCDSGVNYHVLGEVSKQKASCVIQQLSESV
jgi:hypothetical protein